jgi:hypothetical protein
MSFGYYQNALWAPKGKLKISPTNLLIALDPILLDQQSSFLKLTMQNHCQVATSLPHHCRRIIASS